MADATYRYAPSYGVERYKDNNGDGGAEVTNDNLLITLWGVDTKTPFDAGDLIVPSYADPNVPANEQPAYEQAVKSRDSARFFSSLSEIDLSAFMAVLNPSQEYKQRLVDAVVYDGGPVGSMTSYMIKKSLQICYLWEVHSRPSNPSVGQNTYDVGADSDGVSFSDYLGLVFPPASFGSTPIPLPFLKTNGADGEAPVFFDRSTPSGVKDMITAVNKGDFYVAMFITGGVIQGSGYTSIKYPHSVARG